MSTPISERWAIRAILTVSALAFLLILWLLYLKPGAEDSAGAYASLPALNALFNGLSGACVITGFLCIKTQKERAHIACMVSALLLSTLFLVSYFVYHSVHGDTEFLGTGPIRTLYFTVLISHILCTIFVLPLVLTTVYFAVSKRFDSHRRLARFALPVWLYVSATGVAIFFLLRGHS